MTEWLRLSETWKRAISRPCRRSRFGWNVYWSMISRFGSETSLIETAEPIGASAFVIPGFIAHAVHSSDGALRGGGSVQLHVYVPDNARLIASPSVTVEPPPAAEGRLVK